MMKGKSTRQYQICIFREPVLVLLVSIVTLLLQMISFATTWEGSRIYLEGIFPFASLLYAIAIQGTAYFFSNSLRDSIRFLKVFALGVALCCSTYYSYIGIYNSVNSPVTYLQENYTRISYELNGIYDAELKKSSARVKEAVEKASSMILSNWITLESERQQCAACRNALGNTEPSVSSSLRAPRQSAFETYEEYALAYQAYIKSLSEGSKVENDAGREAVLASYGFSSIEELQQIEAQNQSSIQTLLMALGWKEGEAEHPGISRLLVSYVTSVHQAVVAACEGERPTQAANEALDKLLYTADLFDYQGLSSAEINVLLNLCADVSGSQLLPDYDSLIDSLQQKTLNDTNLMELKGNMDSSILSAILKLNSLLPKDSQLSAMDESYRIPDLYLIPILSLKNTQTKKTAYFCLAVAGLIDFLSVLFAVSLRPRKALWKRNGILLGKMEEYAPYLLAALPHKEEREESLSNFLGLFQPSPLTGKEGFMLQADRETLSDYNSLVALLCQLNLARIVPAAFVENPEEATGEKLLLKARFVLWVESVLDGEETQSLENETKKMEKEHRAGKRIFDRKEKEHRAGKRIFDRKGEGVT